MGNQSGNIYGLTILSPIRDDQSALVSPSSAIRLYLGTLPVDGTGPFARVSSTHMARLVVLDDVVYFGIPSYEEHLKSKYLIFETNFDGDLDEYLSQLAIKAATEVQEIWRHCVGFPGVGDTAAFITYMKRCQVETTFYFADVNNRTVQQTLEALQTQSAVSAFIAKNQAKSPEELQKEFFDFVGRLCNAGTPKPASTRGKEFTDELL